MIGPDDFNAAIVGRRDGASLPDLNRRAPPAIDRGSVLACAGRPRLRCRWPTQPRCCSGHQTFNSFRATSCKAPSVDQDARPVRVDAQRRSRSPRVGKPVVQHNQGSSGRHAGARRSRPNGDKARRRGNADRPRPHARRADRPAATVSVMEVRYDLAAMTGATRVASERSDRQARRNNQYPISREGGDRPADPERSASSSGP